MAAIPPIVFDENQSLQTASGFHERMTSAGTEHGEDDDGDDDQVC
jgi:hypothetical protein